MDDVSVGWRRGRAGITSSPGVDWSSVHWLSATSFSADGQWNTTTADPYRPRASTFGRGRFFRFLLGAMSAAIRAGDLGEENTHSFFFFLPRDDKHSGRHKWHRVIDRRVDPLNAHRRHSIGHADRKPKNRKKTEKNPVRTDVGQWAFCCCCCCWCFFFRVHAGEARSRLLCAAIIIIVVCYLFVSFFLFAFFLLWLSVPFDSTGSPFTERTTTAGRFSPRAFRGEGKPETDRTKSNQKTVSPVVFFVRAPGLIRLYWISPGF